MNLTLGERVLILRRRMGLGQKEFGKLLGVTGRTVYNLEHEEGRIKPTMMNKLQIMEQRQEGR